MAYSCCSGNLSSRSFRRCQPYSASSCGSSYPSNLVYTTTSCSPRPCQVESSLNTRCQETCIEPTSCQTSCVMSSPCQVESSVNTRCKEICIEPTSYQSCQETCIEPTSCQRSCVVSRPCQTACYYPRSSTHCRPSWGSYAGSLGFGSSSCSSVGYGSRSCYSGGCGSSGFRSLNCRVSGFPSLSFGSRYCYPSYFMPLSCQPCYRPICGSGLYGISC
ncbi:keratin-associated protein 13-1-like [Alexandromys fortis]|uniref:keratin-associated protein 13-1-like n=1 Tax=Alexandromys fortis TaxID=100897 RepID=UPI0021523D4E|nr:keratin-associated protein 13-1-like [Microtus fortis]XP_049994689.1 keratin-associated protein 13-1-like [Microtus fortis]